MHGGNAGSGRHGTRATKRHTGEMENLKIAFEPFIDNSVRRFIDDGINDYNFAVTGMPEYFPANFVLRSERGEVLGGLLAVIWARWLRVGTLWVSEIARRQGHGSRL